MAQTLAEKLSTDQEKLDSGYVLSKSELGDISKDIELHPPQQIEH